MNTQVTFSGKRLSARWSGANSLAHVVCTLKEGPEVSWRYLECVVYAQNCR